MSEKLPNRLSEAELVRRAQAGDRRSFDVLYESHYQDAFVLARRLVDSVEEAEDVTQEACLNAYRALGGFRGESQFRTWLFRIVTNVAMNHITRKIQQRKIIDKIAQQQMTYYDEVFPSLVEGDLDSLIESLQRIAQEGGPIDQKLAEHPRADHAHRLIDFLREALADDLIHERRLLLALANERLLGSDRPRTARSACDGSSGRRRTCACPTSTRSLSSAPIRAAWPR